MSDYLVDDRFICVFYCDIQRHDISWVVVEKLEMSDVGHVLVLSDEVSDCVNVFYISQFDVGYFKGLPPQESICWGPWLALYGGHSVGWFNVAWFHVKFHHGFYLNILLFGFNKVWWIEWWIQNPIIHLDNLMECID